MVRSKHLDISIFLIVFAISITYFILKTYKDPALFSATLAFSIMASVSLFAALYSKADEPYYENLTLAGLLYTLAAVFGMIAVSTFFVGLFGASVLYFPTVFSSLAVVGGASSIFTAIMGELVFQFAAVATAEELLKFAAYTEIRDRYRSVAFAIAIAVGFWAGFHALQAYKNLYYIVPAFICGVILILLLEHTRCILAPIIAHGAYNTVCVLLTYMQTAVPVEVPWFPTAWTSEDVLLMGLAAMWIAFILLPIFARGTK
ncbi:MAG: CPBP family intramembrane glutamic endopeptidase [Thermofilaceae archaeon]